MDTQYETVLINTIIYDLAGSTSGFVGNHNYIDLITQQINDNAFDALIILKAEMEEKENALFSALNIDSPESFYRKVKIWNSEFAVQFDSFAKQIERIGRTYYGLKGDEEKIDEKIIELIKQSISNGELYKEVSINDEGHLVYTDNNKSTFTFDIKVSHKTKDGQIKPVITKEAELSPEGELWFKRMKKDIGAKAHELKNDFATTKNYLKTLVPDIPASDFFHKYIDQLGKNININKNISTIKGALGEIYWNAFLNYIDLKSSAIGLSGVDEKKREVPIDILFKNMGFQVKNYSEKNNAIEFKSADYYDKEAVTTVSTFIDNYLQKPNVTSRLNMLGQYSTQIPNIVNSAIINYSKANIAKVANFDRDRTWIGDDTIDAYWVGRPVLFLINDKIIRSSQMVDDIIKQLDGNNKRNDFVEIEYSEGPTINWNGFGEENLCSSSSVKYKIKIDMTKYVNYLNSLS